MSIRSCSVGFSKIAFAFAVLGMSSVVSGGGFEQIETLPNNCRASSYGPGDYDRTFAVGSQTRSYLVHVPKSYKPCEPMPVVLNFHGGAGNAYSQIELTGMSDTADNSGFIAVYPQGSGRMKKRFLTFNAGSCCGFARDKEIDDVEYVDRLLKDLEKLFCVDRKRVYATGHSNGAMMSYRLACELPDQIAAIAAVAGPIGIDTCDPDRPVPILHFHGTADKCAPFKGGAGKSKDAGHFRSVDSTISEWLKINGCESKPEISYETGNVVCTTYDGCKGGAEVTLCTIKGGGHAWPGGRKYPAKFICGGELSSEISANDFMWTFFERHPMGGRDGSVRRGAGDRVEPKSDDDKRKKAPVQKDRGQVV